MNLQTLTEEQLIRNINRARNASSNYNREVKRIAYEDMTSYNQYIKQLQQLKKSYQQQGIITDGFRIYSRKAHKMVFFTIYTKIPKYRSYRQQLAITNKQLYKRLYDTMQVRTYNRYLHELYTITIKNRPQCKPIDEFDELDDISTWTLDPEDDI